MIRRQIIFVMFVTAIIMGCNKQSSLDRSLDLAGDNRHELESVLNHYSDNTEKFAAAHFLIDNLPAHYSYAGTEIYEYYDYAARILADTALTPEQQRDSLLFITDAKYAAYIIFDLEGNGKMITNIDDTYIGVPFHIPGKELM